jgi:ribose-phosphate pyrophosphokinase
MAEAHFKNLKDLHELAPMKKNLKLYTGTSNPELAQEIADVLHVELQGLTLEKFSNGEIYARYDESVRGSDVFFIQSVAGTNVNDMLMEVLISCDAAKRASCRTFTAVLPHYGYARQDRKAAPREPITARLVANLLETAGCDRVITLDLHQGQIQGFFDIPVNHLTALPLFAEYYKEKDLDWDNTVVVSPDVGRAKAAKKLSDMLGCSLAIAHKGRPKHNMAEVMAVIGDIDGKTCIINDDMIDTAGTLCGSVKELKAKGAGDIYVGATHGIFSGPAIQRLEDAPIVECVVTDAVPCDEAHASGRIKYISVANEIAEAIYHVYTESSVSGMFGADLTL